MADYRSTTHLRDYCRKLPKVELHAHLNGSISSSTMKKLVENYQQRLVRSGVALKESNLPQDWCTTIEKEDKRTLEECFDMFKLVHTLVGDEEAVVMVAHDVVSEFAADGVVYLELRTTPRDNTVTGMTKKKYIDAVLLGINKAVSECSSVIHVRLLLSIDRQRSVSDAVETVSLAEMYASPLSSQLTRVVGIDFSGNPKAGNVVEFLPILESAKRKGLKLSLHLSEIPGVNEETTMLLKVLPDRIGHGTFLDSSVGGTAENVEFIASRKIPLEICLTSNLKCKTVPSYDQHHLGFWMNSHDAHPVVICTDDKGIFCTTLSEEYVVAAQAFNLSTSDLWTLSIQAVDNIFDERLKDELRLLWKRIE